MSSYKFYYINLDKSIKRKEFMQEQFKNLNIKADRISAVYGKDLDSDFLKKSKAKHNILAHFPYPNDGEIGICETHFKLWDIISKQKEDFAIVLEDDAKISDDLLKDLDSLLININSNDFLDISGKKGFFNLSKNSLISKFLVPPVLMIGQIIGKNSAKILLNNLSEYYAPIDVMKQDVYKHRVSIYSSNKQYIKSYDKILNGSTIQQNNLAIYKKVIREVIRPFWQILSLFSYKSYRVIKNYLYYRETK